MTDGTSDTAKGYLELFKSVAGLVADKIVSVFAGLAAAVSGSIILPISSIVFRQYSPLEGYLESYWEFCIGILLTTLLTWSLTLLWWPRLAWIFHILLCLVAFVISGMMRTQTGLHGIVWVQFLLFFAGIVIACEMFFIAFIQASRKALKFYRDLKLMSVGTGGR
jgi:hypothetical protein